MESRKRSIAKAISWRILAVLITTSVVFLASGRLDLAAEVGLADTAIKIVIYYLHERAWNRISYGRLKREPEYYI
ncbi:MAG: DUF2061 domain-containing protein [Deltaproteobacteria bacterium]|nr:MAG: DUF2061 domain-containing protein [Deltaproteobacteria bacterium]